MAKFGRNDPCPCGSGKKVKRCCIEKLETQRRIDVLTVENDHLRAKNERMKAERDEMERQIAELEAEKQAEVLATEMGVLLDAGRFEQAEAVGRQLEEVYRGETLGVERVAQVYEGREMTASAVARYRRAVALMDEVGEGHYCDCCRARMVKAIRRLDPEHAAPALLRDPQ